MPSFTLVSLHHEDSSPDAILTASIWIAVGDRRTEDGLPCEAMGWRKISGPIELDAAVKVCSELADFLSKNGLDVIHETIAD